MKSKVDLQAFLSFALRPAAQVQLLPSVPLTFRTGGCFARALAARCGTMRRVGHVGCTFTDK